MKKIKISSQKTSLVQMLLDPYENKRIVSMSIYIVLSIIALIMTIINIETSKGTLTYATAIFSTVCAINFFMSLSNIPKLVSMASILFAVELIVAFSFFIISGNPEGFSAIWCCLLPSLGMFFFGRFYGTIICTGMLGIIVFLLDTQLGQTFLYDTSVYTHSFKARFPLLYAAFMILALLLEILRDSAYRELDKLSHIYRDISIRDQLTQLFNREGLFGEMKTHSETKNYRKIGVVIFDIDHFKEVNDLLGHSIGDIVLKEFAEILSKSFNATVCRWGGEEFAMVYYDDAVLQSDMENFRQKIAENIFDKENSQVRITISAGVYETVDHSKNNFNLWINKADLALYRSKNTGRNKVTYY